MNPTMNRIGVSYGGLWRMLHVVLLGQLVSFSKALMSFSSSLSANLGVNSPFALSFSSYFGLALVFGSFLLYRRQKLHISWYWYVLLAFVAVQGSYLANKAFQFSSITSVTILNCWTIVWVIMLTWLFLGTKYSLWQFLGAAICVSGLCLVLLSDSGVGGDGGGSNPVLGDALMIAGTCFFAFSNVGEEFCVKKAGWIEVIAMSSLFAMLMSLTGMIIFELKNLESISWSPQVVLSFIGFGISGFMFFSLTPLVLQASGATLFNLSLLTANMWAVAIRVFIYHQTVDWLYFVSFLFVGVGLVVYSKTEKYSNELPKLENDDNNQPYQLLPGEGVGV
ncbi:putative solute carrier family 35 member SLC35F1/F2/F6 [Helianthus annuus]|uniref:Solute carrier family 35 member SLC35F1/F2/F6 n=2 Tax=Helianthus annuus TaxID=4232 RepID=A0A251T4N4_HELAN|nr:putative solute carrier family 35 member SLC35F1/F2/F6 [Helianthus annuus]KAJ0568195.1 putative solute carrier family 35 member SLC35F1/F2/F6 [Helianthus annuus]